MNDIELGEKVLRAFYNYSRSAYPFASIYSYDELKRALTSRKAGQGFIESLGMSVRFAELSDSKINSSMKALAQASGGKIPSKNSDFYNFMIDEGTKINFIDALIYTATESAKDIGTGVQAVGNTLIDTGKILRIIFIPVVLYFGYQILKKKTSEI